jgi:hypothetical protein
VRCVVRIEFDESPEGQVNSSDPALIIRNSGSGASLSAHAESSEGIRGETNSENAAAIMGIQSNADTTNNAIGVIGESRRGECVRGVSYSDRYAAVVGRGRIAGRFEGRVEVTVDIRVLSRDCAEDFDVSTDVQDIEPGTVMTLNDAGDLEPSRVSPMIRKLLV